MIIPALLLLFGQTLEKIAEQELPNPGGSPRLMIYVEPDKRLDPPKLSPKKFGPDQQPFEFNFITSGFVMLPENPGHYLLRFRVFEQQRKAQNDLSQEVVRMLLRLWEYNYFQLRFDHSLDYNGRIDDVYLCWGGVPGGEQRFDLDRQQDPPAKVDTIYIYDLPSFKDPVEMAREVAHEYGHASIPAIGGYKEPEYWANGYFGEKLFLLNIYSKMRAGLLTPADAMGATEPELKAWLTKNAYPLIVQASEHGPDQQDLAKTDQAGMNAYIGLTLYASQILPPKMFGRALMLVGSYSAKDVPAAIQMAAEEPDDYTLTIPAILAGRKIWVPIGKAHVENATVFKRNDGWALIKPAGSTVAVKNR